MKDLTDTRNHTLRRKIGYLLYDIKVSNKETYSPSNEKGLDQFFRENILISYLAVSLGRKELEERIFDNYNPKYNQKGKRK